MNDFERDIAFSMEPSDSNLMPVFRMVAGLSALVLTAYALLLVGSSMSGSALARLLSHGSWCRGNPARALRTLGAGAVRLSSL